MSQLLADPMMIAVSACAGILLLVLLLSSPKFAVVIAILAFVQTGMKWGSIATGAVDTRPIAVMAIAALLARRAIGRQPAHYFDRKPRLTLAFACFTILGLISVAWSQDAGRSLASSSAWVVLLGMVTVFPAAVGSEFMMKALRITILAMLFISAAMVVVHAPDAWYAGRAMGLFRNPNGLGICCVLASPLLLTDPRTRVKFLWLIPMALCVATGSRAATAAVLASAAVIFWRTTASSLRTLIIPIAAPIAYLAYGQIGSVLHPEQDTSSLILLRDTNSRNLVWSEALATISAHPWLGIGMGALETESGSTALKVAAELGIVGLFAAILVLVFAWLSVRRSTVAASLLVGAIVDAAFEGWLFTAGSLYAVIVFLFLVASEPDGSAPESPDVARLGNGGEKIPAGHGGRTSRPQVRGDSAPTLPPLRQPAPARYSLPRTHSVVHEADRPPRDQPRGR